MTDPDQDIRFMDALQLASDQAQRALFPCDPVAEARDPLDVPAEAGAAAMDQAIGDELETIDADVSDLEGIE